VNDLPVIAAEIFYVNDLPVIAAETVAEFSSERYASP
jgi:hypothetical protein